MPRAILLWFIHYLEFYNVYLFKKNVIELYYSSHCRSGTLTVRWSIYNSVDLIYSVATPAGVNLIYYILHTNETCWRQMRYLQCRRLASTRRPEADWFANGPTALSSCWPGCPTTWLGDEGGGRGRGVRVQDSGRRTSAAQCVYRARVTVTQAVVILASPPTGLLLCSTVRCRYRHLPSLRDTNILVVYS